MAKVFIDSNNVSGTYDGLSWATAFADALTVVTSDGDTVNFASDHFKSYALTTTLSFAANVTLVSVNKTTDVYEVGAIEEVSAGGTAEDFNITQASVSTLTVIGVQLGADDRLDLDNVDGQRRIFTDVVFDLKSTGAGADLVLAAGKGIYAELNSCTIKTASAGGVTTSILDVGPSCVVIDNLKVAGVLVNNLIDLAGNGTATVQINNTDFNQILAVGGSILGTVSANDDAFNLTLNRCKFLPTMLYSVADAIDVIAYSINVSSCDAGDGYHYFYRRTQNGIIEENLSTYLAATYDKAQTLGFSTDLDSTSAVTIGNVLEHELISIVLDLTTSKTITVNFTCANTLTTGEFWIEVTRPDATDMALGVTQSGRVADVLSGAGHTANAEAWTNGLANTYEQSITIPALTGVDVGIVKVTVHLAKPLETVIVCPQIVVS